MTFTWNPRFENYARVHGRTPEAQLAHDKEEWPGGCMAGYMLWMAEKGREWKKKFFPDDTTPARYLVLFYPDKYEEWLFSLPTIEEG